MPVLEEDEREEGKRPKPGEKKAWKPKAGSKAEQLAVSKSSQYSSAALPDVARTPAAPSPVPIPYPNVGKAGDAAKGSKKVKIKGKDVKLGNKSLYKKSAGDEAATKSFGQGVVSQKTQGKQYFSAWSMDAKTEGKNVTRRSNFRGSGSSLNDDGVKPSQNKAKVEVGGGPEYLKYPKEEGQRRRSLPKRGR
jgi:hypothetical protein